MVFDHDHQWEYRLGRITAPSWSACAGQLAADGICVFDPVPMFGSDTPAAFAEFCRFSFDVASRLNGVKLLVAEEIDSATDVRRPLAPAVRDVLGLGRRAELDLLAVSQSPQDVHRQIRRQLTAMAVFRFSDSPAVAWLKDSGFDPGEVISLPKYAYLWKPAGQPARICR
jgi:hypothetical protein